MMSWVLSYGLHIVEDAVEALHQAGLRTFSDFMQFPGGQRVCHKPGRSVYRIETSGRAFYLKRNRLQPAEFWKSLSRLRLPRLGAQTEWENILAVRQLGIPTVSPVAFGVRHVLGIESASFTLTEELYGAEPLNVIWSRRCVGSPTKAQHRRRRDLVRRLAELARRFHGSGMNHQDFYLNHFFIKGDDTLFLLDLQRVQRRPRVPGRYLVKDLAQLNYSTHAYGGFTNSDRLRFLLLYLDAPRLSTAVRALATEILAKTTRIARHDVKLRERRRRRGELP